VVNDFAALSSELPAPRDDEPAGLRQDILDELADHLACSYNRELLRGTDPAEARRRAAERFGNPAAVARRLWFDAMKGKIMAQRVLMATCLCVIAACFGMVALMWNQSSRSAAQVAEANRQMADLIGQTQATNQEMLRQLQAMARPAQPAKSAEWIPVKFRLTVEKPDGPPAVGYEVILGRGHGGTTQAEAIHRTSDATGLTDFGVVQPGDWEFSIVAGIWKANGGLNAVPGTSISKEIVCPKMPPDRAEIRVRVNWPGPLADKHIVAVALFKPKVVTYQPPLVWSPMQGGATNGVQFIGRPRGGFTVLDQDLVLTAETPNPNGPLDNHFFSSAYIDRLRAQGGIHSIIALDPSTSDEGPLEVWAGRYSLARLMIFRCPPGGAGTVAGECELLTLMSQPGDEGAQVHVTGGGMGTFVFLRSHRIKLSSLDQYDHFEARPGQTAEWMVSLPEEMIKEVEKRLKPDATPKNAG
jgi:hypothetical protein